MLRGWYTTVTLAVYGVITRAPIVAPIPKPSSPLPVVAPPATEAVEEKVYVEEKSLNSTPLIEEERSEVPARVEEPERSAEVVVPNEGRKDGERVEEPSEKEVRTKKDEDKKEIVSEKWEKEKEKEKEKERTRINPEKGTKSDHRSRHEADRPDRYRATDSDRYRSESDRHKTEKNERERDRERRKDRSRERDRERRKDRSPREKERTEKTSSRRPRTPPATPPPTIVEEPAKKSSPEAEISVKTEEFEDCGMEAISDDDMPEVDNVLIAQNAGDVVDVVPEEEEEEEEEEAVLQVTKTEQEIIEENDPVVPDSSDTLVISEVMDTEEQQQEELEEILSDEDLMFEEYAEMELDLSEFGAEEVGKSFNPYGIELQPLQSLADPSATSFQRTAKNLSSPQLLVDRKDVEEAGTRLKTILELNSRGEKWIESMGHMAVILPNALAHLQTMLDAAELELIHERIILSILDGLDFERARQQVPSTHTVRQIKCGLNLSLAIGQSCCSLMKKSIDAGILSRIMTLYSAPHMALSLKLMCLRSLDVLLGWPLAMEHFLKNKFLSGSNGYYYLIELLEGSQPSRARVSLAALVKKINVFEAMEKVYRISLILARENNPIEPFLKELVDSLYAILKIYRNPKAIQHFTRFLPVQHQFEILVGSEPEPLQGLYSFMRHHRFLSVLLLLINPLSGSDLVVVDVVIHFLEEMGRSKHGLCFLACNPEATTLILRTLMHSPDDESGVEESTLHRLGVQLAHSLYIIQCLDVLNVHVISSVSISLFQVNSIKSIL